MADLKTCAECGNIDGTPHEVRCSRAQDPLARAVRSLHAAADNPNLSRDDLAQIVFAVRDNLRELKRALQGVDLPEVRRALDALRDIVPEKPSDAAEAD